MCHCYNNNPMEKGNIRYITLAKNNFIFLKNYIYREIFFNDYKLHRWSKYLFLEVLLLSF